MTDPGTIFGTDLHTRFAGSSLSSLGAGGAISSWADATGHGHAATQATAGKRPTAQQDTNGGKTFWVARFAGASQTALATASFTAVHEPAAFLAVVKLSAVATSAALIDGIVATNGLRMLFWVDPSTSKWSIFGTTTLRAAAADTSWHVLIGVFNGASSSIYQDGASPFTGSNGNGSETTTGFTLGNSSAQSSTAFSGDIADLSFVTAVPTAQQVVNYDSWAQDSFGVTVADYVSSTPRSVQTLLGGALVTKPIKTLVGGSLV